MRNRYRSRLLCRALEERAVPAVYTVANNLDAGAGSFRQAILDSNANPGPDSITFDPVAFAGAQTITLDTALPEIEDDLTVTGTGSTKLRIERSASAATNFRVLTVDQGSRQLTVNLTGMTLAKGNLVVTPNTQNPSLTQVINGGGLYIADESVTLTDMVITQNTSNQQGGGVASGPGGQLTLIECTVSNNVAKGDVGGITVLGQTFSGVGGGVYFTYDGSLTVISSAITGNTAKVRGAGIYLYGEIYGKGLIRNTTIANNVVTAPTFINTSGGGGVSVNTHTSLGGKYNLQIQNSTIVNNDGGSGGYGGGLLASGVGTTVRVESTIISSNVATTGTDGSAGPPPILGGSDEGKITIDYSAIGSTSNFTYTNGPGGSASNKIGLSLLLGPLGLNGGKTANYLPQAGSPLIDAGQNSAGISTDQRGLSRYYNDPATAGNSSNVDIGAAEFQPTGLPRASVTLSNVTTAGGTNYVFQVTYSDPDGTNNGINVSTLKSGNVRVQLPNNTKITPTFNSVTPAGNGTPRVATYTYTPPGGSWDVADIGTYKLEVSASSVSDLDGQFVPAGPLGSFNVALPQTFIVTNNADDGPGSLRAAIASANAVTPSQDTITFSAALLATFPTIDMSTGLMRITDSVVIQGGSAAQQVTLNGNFASRHFWIDGTFPLSVSISGMTLKNGRTTGQYFSERGGSILLGDDSLTLNNVLFGGNQNSKSYGGAIYAGGGGSVVATSTKFEGNSATNLTGGGGAVASLDPGHSFSFTDCSFSGNQGGLYGGAIFSTNGGTTTVDRCVFLANTTVQSITVDDENAAAVFGGGAIAVGGQITADQTPRNANLRVTNSTFDSNNSPRFGGAVLFAAPTPSGSWLRNCTFFGNEVNSTSNGIGGAIFAGGLVGTTPFYIDNSTIAYNKAYSGGGLFVGNADTSVYLRSTIIAKNICADPTQLPVDIDGNVNAEFSLIGVLDGAGLLTNTGNLLGSATNPLDPDMAASLANNGGPTRTFKLNATSPARDVGSNPAGLTFDQRGTGYARVVNGAPDIGSYEADAVVAPAKVSTLVINDGSAQRSRVTSLTVTFTNSVAFTGAVAGAFELTRVSDSAFVDIDATIDVTNKIVTITFIGGAVDGAPGNYSLQDGRYVLTAFANQFTGAGLDGNGDGIAGDNYVSISAANTPPTVAPTGIFRLFGDADGNGQINSADFLAFRLSFLSANAAFDFDGDGQVNAADFLAFRLRFLATIS
ncbi:MAG: hypothetical protein K1X57_12605 [Gemmataceae bacterium]|nr:hypothetical protein [Gemmataceae bacterium]